MCFFDCGHFSLLLFRFSDWYCTSKARVCLEILQTGIVPKGLLDQRGFFLTLLRQLHFFSFLAVIFEMSQSLTCNSSELNWSCAVEANSDTSQLDGYDEIVFIFGCVSSVTNAFILSKV